MTDDNKIYFLPGDIVTLRLNIPNVPTMIVVKKVNSMINNKRDNEEGILRGIKCRWFTTDGYIQEEIFNTKDLKLLK